MISPMGRPSSRTEPAGLARELSLLSVVIDAIPGPVFYKDEHGIYIGCNRAFEQYIGLPRERIIGASVYDISPKELADKYKAMDDALLKSRNSQVYEFQVRYADGSLHDVVFHKGTFEYADGSVAGIIGVMLDITQRKQAERLLRESQDALREQKEALEKQNEQMAAPMLALGRDHIVVPLVGALGAGRARILQERLLERVAASSLQAVFIDVMGLEDIDPQAASSLIRLCRAVQLLGAECSLTGISADMARALIEIGARLSSIRTYASLSHALQALTSSRG